MMVDKKCDNCNYFSVLRKSRSSNAEAVYDAWCFRFNTRSLDKFKGCREWKEKNSQNISEINPVYAGSTKRESETHKNQIIYIILAGAIGIFGVILGVMLGSR